MSFLNLFGNKISESLGGPRSRSISSDKNSQTDFDFDDAATDGRDIGIRVDPRPTKKRNVKVDNTQAVTPDINNPDQMMIAERMFYDQPDTDEHWSVQPVSSPEHHDAGTKGEEKEFPCMDPCDPCQKYKDCMQVCMTQDHDAEHVEEDRCEVKEKHGGRRPCNDQCRSSSREKKRAGNTDKPRRQCSDLCRVAKKRQEHVEDPCNDPCADPCKKQDPCADPCKKKDPCADVARDPCFDANAHESCDDPCARPDPCNDPCRRPKPKSNPCYDPCRDPCRDPCNDPCPQACPQNPCEQHEENAEHPSDAKGDAHGEADAEHSAGPCCPCPPCPACPPCPQCPECPACPPCPSPPPTNKAYGACRTSSSSSDRFVVSHVKETKEEPTPVNETAKEEITICPEPLFPLCKQSEESCKSIVCPEDD